VLVLYSGVSCLFYVSDRVRYMHDPCDAVCVDPCAAVCVDPCAAVCVDPCAAVCVGLRMPRSCRVLDTHHWSSSSSCSEREPDKCPPPLYTSILY